MQNERPLQDNWYRIARMPGLRADDAAATRIAPAARPAVRACALPPVLAASAATATTATPALATCHLTAVAAAKAERMFIAGTFRKFTRVRAGRPEPDVVPPGQTPR